MEEIIKVKQYICDKCKYRWCSRVSYLPKQCPNCKRQDWNIDKSHISQNNKKVRKQLNNQEVI